MVSLRGSIGCYASISMNISDMVNVITMHRYKFCANIPMNISDIANVITMQRYKFCANIPMNIFCNINTLMVQRRRCCSFDSPGLVRNEPTLGKRSQGDSTPSVLSFFCGGTLIMKHFMTDYTKKPQHLWRWFTHNIH